MKPNGKNPYSQVLVPLVATLLIVGALWIGIQFVQAPVVRPSDKPGSEEVIHEAPMVVASRPEPPVRPPPTATPHPDLDEDWDSLPELGVDSGPESLSLSVSDQPVAVEDFERPAPPSDPSLLGGGGYMNDGVVHRQFVQGGKRIIRVLRWTGKEIDVGQQVA